MSSKQSTIVRPTLFDLNECGRVILVKPIGDRGCPTCGAWWHSGILRHYPNCATSFWIDVMLGYDLD